MVEKLQPEGINNLQPDKENALEKLIIKRLDALGIRPNENLGQHFLIDQTSINLLAQSVNPDNTVVEVGAGVGQLTEALAQKATKVISIEIDRRYEPVLDDVVNKYPNVNIIFGDALTVKFEDLLPKHQENAQDDNGTRAQIVASLPYHIVEPFLHKLIGLPIESATLVVGQKLRSEIQAKNEESMDFGRLTLLAQTFFDIEVIATVEKDKFFPVPRTESAIIRLTPKEKQELRFNRRDFILRKLFITANKNPLVKNILKEGIVEFAEIKEMGAKSKKEYYHKLRQTVNLDLRRMVDDYNYFGKTQSTPDKSGEREDRILAQNQTSIIIEKMGIPSDILGKPFERLSNYELGILSNALRKNL